MFYVSENVYEFVFMHTAVACVHKCFTLTGGLKSDKCECLWGRYLPGKNIFILKQKSSNLYIIVL